MLIVLAGATAFMLFLLALLALSEIFPAAFTWLVIDDPYEPRGELVQMPVVEWDPDWDFPRAA